MVIRTFDLGGDKLPPFLALDELRNRSSLHLRGLRFSLSEKNLLDAQLRAIVQVAQTADVRILFPMVIGSHDFALAIAAVDRAVQQLDVLRRPPVGAMIETPAALFALDEILELADFVAIGTNDLTQYMLAADRDLSEGTDDCTAMHPAVLRAIKQIVQVERAGGIDPYASAAKRRQTPTLPACLSVSVSANLACAPVAQPQPAKRSAELTRGKRLSSPNLRFNVEARVRFARCWQPDWLTHRRLIPRKRCPNL